MRSRASRRSPVNGSAAVNGLGAGLDLDGAVATGCADEPPDRPSSPVFDLVPDDQGGEHDRKMGFDRVALVVVDRAGLQLVFDIPNDFSVRRSRRAAPHHRAWRMGIGPGIGSGRRLDAPRIGSRIASLEVRSCHLFGDLRA